ncbi:UDP-N-acetylmuramate--L-alanine ligase [Nymphaea thermarum]|nr:UDP-N-acetylmuramate--L-alanine ligase [Nymphaea thermarum]
MCRLKKAGARLHLGHSSSNLCDYDGLVTPSAVIKSSAIPADNEEILQAEAFGMPVHSRCAWLGKITDQHNLIAVSGTHGKSTTTAMLAFVLSEMGENPTALVGAHVPQFSGGNILSGCSCHFVLEADEYDGAFLELSPSVAVVTNIEWEHVDLFEDEVG